jgi:hypothetical protein
LPGAVVSHQLAQYAFPQAPVRDPKPIRRPNRPYCLENGATRQHKIGTVGTDAGIGNPLLKIPAKQLFHHEINAATVHP